MKQVTILGLGVMGTSLGLALKQLKSPPRVVGCDVQYDAAQGATRLKAVDQIERDPLVAVRGSELVILAAPVGAIQELIQTIAPSLEQGSVVTDLGSTKREIVRKGDELLSPNAAFVGGHPMTGPTTAGVDGPSASIYSGAIYCLTPTANTPPDAVQMVANMVHEIGAEAYFLDPSEHDGLVAAISHLPYLVSVAVMRCLAGQPGWREMSTLAAGGFDTATRLSGSGATMFADVLTTNADNVARQLDRLVEELQSFKLKLLNCDPGIERDLEEAQSLRRQWEEERRPKQ
ncbi:MAG TPA: prephenate dehydrogenase [Chloroflexota bacterium]|nr:prephenate dehydrogenase [Chloroflexota bacterium]